MQIKLSEIQILKQIQVIVRLVGNFLLSKEFRIDDFCISFFLKVNIPR